MSGDAELATATRGPDVVPGDPDRLRAVAGALRSYAADLADTARGFTHLTPAAWTGSAADAFRARIACEPDRWHTASDAFAQAAQALDVYATALRLAQDDADRALARLHDATATTFSPYLPAGAGLPTPDHDRLAVEYRLARYAVDDARTRVRAAGAAAQHAVRAATDHAPRGPSWWQTTATTVLALGRTGARLAHDDVLVPTANAVASLASAAGHDPTTTACLIGGIALTAVSAAGDATGAVLTATGVAAPAGIPLTALSTAGVVAGAAVITTAAGTLAIEAREHPVQAMHRSSNEPAPAGPTPDADRIRGKVRDLSSGIRRGNGQVENESELQNTWQKLTQGQAAMSAPDGRRLVEFPDGTRIQWRESSRSGGPVIDVDLPGEKPIKIHLAKGSP